MTATPASAKLIDPKGVFRSATEKLQEQLDAKRPPAPTAAAYEPQLFAFEVLDAAAAKDLDPLLPPRGIVRLDAPWTEPVTVRVGEIEVLRLEPTASGQAHLQLSGGVYDAVVASEGHERAAETCERWGKQAEAWARDALEGLPSSRLSLWRHEDRARRTMVADRLVHSWGVPLEQARKIVGDPVDVRRTLWPTLLDANALDESARVEAEARARAEAEAAAIAAEEARPKSLRELGIDVVAVDKKRVTVTDGAQGVPEALSPFPGAHLVAESEGELFFGWKAILGLELVPFEEHGIRALSREETFVPQAPAPAPSRYAATYCKQVRDRHGAGLDRGPVTRWSEQGIDRGRELAREYADAFVRTSPYAPDLWRREWLLQALCRGLRLRPDLAADIVLERLREILLVYPWPGQKRGEEPALPRDDVGALAVAAAEGGSVSAGALLEESVPTFATKAGRSRR